LLGFDNTSSSLTGSLLNTLIMFHNGRRGAGK
jgi:hypothetical protein